MIFTSNDGKNNMSYYFELAQTKDGGLFIVAEDTGSNVSIENNPDHYFHNFSLEESKCATARNVTNVVLQDYIASLQVFHFHDTSSTSYLRRLCDINDNLYLKQDGRNLAAILYLLKIKHPKIFSRTEKNIQSIAPVY